MQQSALLQPTTSTPQNITQLQTTGPKTNFPATNPMPTDSKQPLHNTQNTDHWATQSTNQQPKSKTMGKTGRAKGISDLPNFFEQGQIFSFSHLETTPPSLVLPGSQAFWI